MYHLVTKVMSSAWRRRGWAGAQRCQTQGAQVTAPSHAGFSGAGCLRDGGSNPGRL